MASKVVARRRARRRRVATARDDATAGSVGASARRARRRRDDDGTRDDATTTRRDDATGETRGARPRRRRRRAREARGEASASTTTTRRRGDGGAARDEARGHGDERAVRIRGVLRDKNRAQEVVRAVRAVLGDDARCLFRMRAVQISPAMLHERLIRPYLPIEYQKSSERFRRRGDEDEGGEKRDARRVVG